jgi:hypothetical protein
LSLLFLGSTRLLTTCDRHWTDRILPSHPQ